MTIAAFAKQLEARTGNGQLNKLKNIFLSSILNLQPECVPVYLDAVDDCRHRPNSGGRNILGGGSKCREYYSTRFSLGQTPPHISTQGTEIALRDLIIPISEWKLRLTYLGTVDGPSSRLIVQNIKSDHDETCCRYLNRIVPKNVHILADSSTNRPLTKVVSHSIRRKWCPCFYFNLDGLRTAMLVGDL